MNNRLEESTAGHGRARRRPEPESSDTRQLKEAPREAIGESSTISSHEKEVPVMTVNIVRRSLLVATAVGGLMLAGVPLASAATLPAAVAVPSAVGTASPGTGLPVVGGLVDSVVGIITGTAYGIGGAASAVVCSLESTACSVPAH
jgi:hypothetical protein